MRLSDGNLYLESSVSGARAINLQMGHKHFLFPQQFVKRNDDRVLRGGMHICSPIFGSPEGKGIFSQAPQHGELRDMHWERDYQTFSCVLYSTEYQYWGKNFQYYINYSLDGANRLSVVNTVNNIGDRCDIELGWHPYFNAPEGGKIRFTNTDIPDIYINNAYGPQIFPATKLIVITLKGLGTVAMELGQGFDQGFVCVWTDWLEHYLCVEPLLSYKDNNPGIRMEQHGQISADFSLSFSEYQD